MVDENGKLIRRHRNFDTLAEKKMAAAVFTMLPMWIVIFLVVTFFYSVLWGIHHSIVLNSNLRRALDWVCLHSSSHVDDNAMA